MVLESVMLESLLEMWLDALEWRDPFPCSSTNHGMRFTLPNKLYKLLARETCELSFYDRQVLSLRASATSFRKQDVHTHSIPSWIINWRSSCHVQQQWELTFCQPLLVEARIVIALSSPKPYPKSNPLSLSLAHSQFSIM